MNDSDSLAKLGATGKTRWRQQFTWKVIAPRYEAILRGQMQTVASDVNAETS